MLAGGCWHALPRGFPVAWRGRLLALLWPACPMLLPCVYVACLTFRTTAAAAAFRSPMGTAVAAAAAADGGGGQQPAGLVEAWQLIEAATSAAASAAEEGELMRRQASCSQLPAGSWLSPPLHVSPAHAPVLLWAGGKVLADLHSWASAVPSPALMCSHSRPYPRHLPCPRPCILPAAKRAAGSAVSAEQALQPSPTGTSAGGRSSIRTSCGWQQRSRSPVG